MSILSDCRAATMTLKSCGTYSSFTPSLSAIAFAMMVAGPKYSFVLGSWPSQGSAAATPTRKVPAFLILSIVALAGRLPAAAEPPAPTDAAALAPAVAAEVGAGELPDDEHAPNAT